MAGRTCFMYWYDGMYWYWHGRNLGRNGGRIIRNSDRKTGTVRGKTHFIVIREFTGKQTMAEAFGQLVDMKAYERFEREMAEKKG